MNMTTIKAALAMGLLLLAGCGGPDKLACDPSLPAGYALSHEPPPPGFAPPTLMPPPCTPEPAKTVADAKPTAPKPSNSPAVAGR